MNKGTMFNEYYIFDEIIDEKLKRLGFVKNPNKLIYTMLCQDRGLNIKYTVSHNQVRAAKVIFDYDCIIHEGQAFTEDIEEKTFTDIIKKLEKVLDKVDDYYSMIVESEYFERSCSDKGTRCIGMNSYTYEKLDVKNKKIDVDIRLNPRVMNNRIKVYF